MEVAAYLYPWDILGDPAAADRVAGLGLRHVAVAATYHATRAMTPRHPWHRVVVAEHSAAYFPLSADLWDGVGLRPAGAPWTGSADSFGEASAALGSAGVEVQAWVVVNHVDLPGPNEFAILNAYGDRYPWALCPAQDAVQEYAVGLAGEVAALPDITGVELEACGWYGFDHLSAHDKVGGVRLGGAEQYLFSLCFCDSCDGAYRAGGVDPGLLRTRVRAALDPVFAGAPAPGQPGDELAGIDALLGAELSEAVRQTRDVVAERYRAVVVDRIRSERPELTILAHASPQPHRYIAFTGIDPGRAVGVLDGLVVNCWKGPEEAAATRAAAGPELPVLASLLAIEGMGGRPAELVEQAHAVRAAGATGLRLYHAGLAGNTDLDGIRELTGTIAKGADQ
jgi:hypothetical protein